jgi:hypothetical protein
MYKIDYFLLSVNHIHRTTIQADMSIIQRLGEDILLSIIRQVTDMKDQHSIIVSCKELYTLSMKLVEKQEWHSKVFINETLQHLKIGQSTLLAIYAMEDERVDLWHCEYIKKKCVQPAITKLKMYDLKCDMYSIVSIPYDMKNVKELTIKNSDVFIDSLQYYSDCRLERLHIEKCGLKTYLQLEKFLNLTSITLIGYAIVDLTLPSNAKNVEIYDAITVDIRCRNGSIELDKLSISMCSKPFIAGIKAIKGYIITGKEIDYIPS